MEGNINNQIKVLKIVGDKRTFLEKITSGIFLLIQHSHSGVPLNLGSLYSRSRKLGAGVVPALMEVTFLWRRRIVNRGQHKYRL